MLINPKKYTKDMISVSMSITLFILFINRNQDKDSSSVHFLIFLIFINDLRNFKKKKPFTKLIQFKLNKTCKLSVDRCL